MVLLAPTVAPEQVLGAGSASGPTGPRSPGAVDPGAPTTGVEDAEGGGSAPTAAGIPAAAACPGFQVPEDPYSPPCARWSGGDNGGATARGVTRDEIIVAGRDAGLPDLGSIIAQFSGVNDYVSSTAELVRTAEVLIEYFNEHYQFYGRRLSLDYFRGQGNLLDEFLGGGQAGAQADGISAAQEHNALRRPRRDHPALL